MKMHDFVAGDVRLSSGKLELLHNNEWGTVCSANFDNMTANVACKQLGLRWYIFNLIDIQNYLNFIIGDEWKHNIYKFYGCSCSIFVLK